MDAADTTNAGDVKRVMSVMSVTEVTDRRDAIDAGTKGRIPIRGPTSVKRSLGFDRHR